MSGSIGLSRRRIKACLDGNSELAAVSNYAWFFVYIMGPYHDDQGTKQPMALLESIRDALREAEFQAFLATDVEDDEIDELDYATQTVEFSRFSNAIVFVLPESGKNLGPGIEIGAVLERLAPGQSKKRVLIIHESLEASMLTSIATRWDAVVELSDFEEIVDPLNRIKWFIRNVMEEEGYGDLSDTPHS